MMKKLLLFLPMLLLFCCTSKEDKALKLIDRYMFKHLFDYASYEPIETKVDSAFATVYTDSAIRSHAYRANAALSLGQEASKKAGDALDYAGIYANSYYSRGKFNQYMEEVNAENEKVKYYIKIIDLEGDTIRMMANQLSADFKGWSVSHKFRAKTKGGNSSIGYYEFIIDPKFSQILSQYDTEDEDEIKVRNVINELLGQIPADTN